MISAFQDKESGRCSPDGTWSPEGIQSPNSTLDSNVTAGGAHSSVNGLPRIAVFVSGGGTNLQALIDAAEAAKSKEPAGEVGSGDSVTEGKRVIEGNRVTERNHRLNALIVLVMADRPGCYALDRAANHGIRGEMIDRKAGSPEEREQKILALLEEVEADVIVLAGFLGILGAGVIEKYRDRIVNVHPSLIPKYCGKGFYGHHVHEAVLAAGDTETGVTVHLVDEGVDTGRILMQRKVPVMPGDTPESLYARLQPVEHQTLVEAVGVLIAEKFGRS